MNTEHATPPESVKRPGMRVFFTPGAAQPEKVQEQFQVIVHGFPEQSDLLDAGVG